MDPSELKRREQIVVSEYRGILPYCEAYYIVSILYSAERALDAYSRYVEGVAEQRPPLVVISAIQEALTHAAALSRFFWPARAAPLHGSQADRLRDALSITEESPLKDKSLRNAIEHFDERLDNFLLRRDVGHFFPSPMVGDHRLADETTGGIFKLVDPDERCFVLLSEKYYFRPVFEEVQRVFAHAQSMVASGRLSFSKEAPENRVA